MTYEFQITEDKFIEWQDLIQTNWGKFYTDFTFEISWVKGNVEFKNWTLTIEITDKPWLASWDMIEGKLNEFFN